MMEELNKLDGKWEQRKTRERAEKARSTVGSLNLNVKRQQREPELGGKPSKRYKYELVGSNWGKTTDRIGAKTTIEEQRMVTNRGGGAESNKARREEGEDGQGSKDGRSGTNPSPLTPPQTTDHESTKPHEDPPDKDGHPPSLHEDIGTTLGGVVDAVEVPYETTETQTSAVLGNQNVRDDTFREYDDSLRGEVTIQECDERSRIVTRDDREQSRSMNNENECDTEVATGTPSIDRKLHVIRESLGAEGSLSVCQNVSVSVSTEDNCVITDGICKNGCEIKLIKVSSRKRVQNKKTKLWYDRSMKITKPICVRRRTGSEPAGSERGSEDV